MQNYDLYRVSYQCIGMWGMGEGNESFRLGGAEKVQPPYQGFKCCSLSLDLNVWELAMNFFLDPVDLQKASSAQTQLHFVVQLRPTLYFVTPWDINW